MTHTPTSFLKSVAPKWKKLKSSMSQTPGSPLILIVTSAAIRATDFIRYKILLHYGFKYNLQ